MAYIVDDTLTVSVAETAPPPEEVKFPWAGLAVSAISAFILRRL